ncbi:hypothetical protein R1sor_006743 [Riccia sorocarpa]|uniref:Uncharacterized protein n=1 Tax=Riccia sorocarpa TaxID=122646 RepID=A0ABD3HNE6_9MARC
MSTVRELQTTLALQEKGKKDVKVEVGIDRIKAFASASVPRDLKIKLLKVHYSSDAALRSASFHPQGNDLDNDIRPWLHQWAMWAMLETYCLNMLSSCVALHAAIVTEEVVAEEEEKFLKHFDSYRQKVWKTVWNSGKNDRHLIIDGRRAKRLFFRYAVWVRVFETLPACFTLWRLPPDETYSMFSNDDPFSTKWDDLADWERANCPFYREQMESPVTMYDDWESHCYGRFQEWVTAEVALAESSQQPERIPELEAELKTAQEKLQQVFDPRKLQSLSADECLAQAKEFEPRADQVVTTFTKLKRKKDDQMPKTPTIEVDEEAKDGGNFGGADSTPTAPKSNRRPRKKKAEIAPEVPAHNPSREPVEAVEAAVEDTGTAAETAPEIRTAKRIKKKSAETKDFVNGEYRQDLQFAMERKWVPVEASLGNVFHALRSKKQGAGSRAAVPALEAISSMCARLRAVGRRPKPFMIKNSKSDQGADLIMYDIPSGRAASPDSEVPAWNLFPAAANYPRHVLNLASKLLDDNRFVIIFHARSLESSQQIIDNLEAMKVEWKPFLSYDVCNDAPPYVPRSKLSAEVIVRAKRSLVVPKQEYWPFDKNNTGRDTLTIFNYNSKLQTSREGEVKKMPDSARSTAKPNAWVERLHSPSRSGLPSYTENMVNYLADLPTPPSTRAALQKQNIHGRAINFVDDEAREASSESPEYL